MTAFNAFQGADLDRDSTISRVPTKFAVSPNFVAVLDSADERVLANIFNKIRHFEASTKFRFAGSWIAQPQLNGKFIGLSAGGARDI
jgi:hypothetical protein